MWVVLRRQRELRLVLFVSAGLAVAIPTAHAAPRQVVIINAAKDQAAGFSAAKRVRRSLEADADLEPLDSGDLARGFEAALTGKTAEQTALANASQLYAEAEKLFVDEFNTRPAKRKLDRAEAELLSVAPTETIVVRLADVSFLYGLIHLREQNRGLALDAFATCRMLDPNRPEPDPGTYKPDIVKTFKQAGGRTKAKKSAKLSISATYDVPIYIDGVKVGKSPVKDYPLPPGKHYVVAATPEYRTVAAIYDLAANESRSEKLELRAIPSDDQARNLRGRAIGNGGVKGQTLIRLARDGLGLVPSVDAAIVITDGDHGTIATVYDRTADRVSYSRPADADISKMFGLLVAVPEPILPSRPDLFDNSTPRKTPWIKTTPGILTLLGSGVVATTVTVVILNAALGGTTPVDRGSVVGGPK